MIPAAEEFQPDLVLISAGYDAHRDDRLGGCELEASSFAEMARHIRGLGERTGAPVGAVLEGGYALDALGVSVRATMEALAGEQPPDSTAPDFFTSRAASHVGFRWRLNHNPGEKTAPRGVPDGVSAGLPNSVMIGGEDAHGVANMRRRAR